jgi:hypothetical protein
MISLIFFGAREFVNLYAPIFGAFAKEMFFSWLTCNFIPELLTKLETPPQFLIFWEQRDVPQSAFSNAPKRRYKYKTLSRNVVYKESGATLDDPIITMHF